MGIGGSIFLIAVGAILTWAVHFQVGWLDLRVVGYILMIAGVAGLILTMWFWNTRRRYPPVPVEREQPPATDWSQQPDVPRRRRGY